jgi:hypothetical protein
MANLVMIDRNCFIFGRLFLSLGVTVDLADVRTFTHTHTHSSLFVLYLAGLLYHAHTNVI